MNEKLLKELCETWAPVGRTSRLSGLIAQRLGKAGLEVRTDALGNVVSRTGQGAARVFVAHIDQQCWVIEHKDRKGLLHLKAVPANSKLGEGWGVDGESRVYRIFTEDEGKAFRAEGLAKDWGEVGTFITPRPMFEANSQKVFAAALADRVCAALLVETATDSISSDRSLAFLFYTGRNLAYSGLAAGLAGLDIERLYMLEAVACGKDSGGPESGEGVVVVLRTPYSVPPAVWISEIDDISQASNIKLQRAFLSGVSSGADALSPRGVPSLVLGVGLGYQGTAIERLHRGDYDEVKKLTRALAQGTV